MGSRIKINTNNVLKAKTNIGLGIVLTSYCLIKAELIKSQISLAKIKDNVEKLSSISRSIRLTIMLLLA